MSKYTFVFDLDSTITKAETLPLIASLIGKEAELSRLTSYAMQNNIDFKDDFAKRVNLLKDTDINTVSNLICNIDVNKKVVEFIHKNKDDCYIITGNLAPWIDKLIEKISPKACFCSSAISRDNKIIGLDKIINKLDVIKTFPRPIVAIGDGSNDIEMIKYADIGIAFSTNHALSNEIISSSDITFDNEENLCEYLNSLI